MTNYPRCSVKLGGGEENSVPKFSMMFLRVLTSSFQIPIMPFRFTCTTYKQCAMGTICHPNLFVANSPGYVLFVASSPPTLQPTLLCIY